MKRFLIAGCVVAAAAMVFAPVVRAQEKALAFDAASIRKNVNNAGRCGPDQAQATPSGFHMTNCPLWVALATAYAPTKGEALGFAMGDRMVGMPDWVKSEHYDIDARIGEADAEAWKDPVRQREMLHAMLQALLAERCKLVVHREMKDRSTYAIMVGKNGPKLPAAETAENADLDALQAKYPNSRSVPGGPGVWSNTENGGIDFYGVKMGILALWMSDFAKEPVVDKTGLTGRYDIHIPRMQNMQADSGGADGLPTVFSVMDGFGLKLEKQKDQVEVLVIDYVERPTEN